MEISPGKARRLLHFWGYTPNVCEKNSSSDTDNTGKGTNLDNNTNLSNLKKHKHKGRVSETSMQHKKCKPIHMPKR